MVFFGRYVHSLDEKSRLILPIKLREKLGGVVFLTVGLDHCLYLYPEETFAEKVKELKALSDLQKEDREYKRTFFSNSFECEVDRQGRILLPKDVLLKVGIEREVILVGNDDKVEIWQRNRYEEVEALNYQNYESNAQSVAERSRR